MSNGKNCFWDGVKKQFLNSSKKDKQIIILNKESKKEEGIRLNMKNKKIIIIFCALFIFLIIGGYFLINYLRNDKEETVIEEYIPEEEISEEQSRQTIVSLYFQNNETKELEPEARLVDIKEILNDPYEKIVNLLIEGPKDETKEKIIPDNVKLLNTILEGDCITLDFSQEFLNYDKEDEKVKENLINSLVNTLTQLNEVNSIKILINGSENEEFKEVYMLEKVTS